MTRKQRRAIDIIKGKRKGNLAGAVDAVALEMETRRGIQLVDLNPAQLETVLAVLEMWQKQIKRLIANCP